VHDDSEEDAGERVREKERGKERDDGKRREHATGDARYHTAWSGAFSISCIKRAQWETGDDHGTQRNKKRQGNAYENRVCARTREPCKFGESGWLLVGWLLDGAI
jgi:hypothetical protein